MEVDLLLVVALDVSASVDGREFKLMREGFAAAMASPEVANAVSTGRNGEIAIIVTQWSGFTEQDVMINWTRATGLDDLQQLAGDILLMKRRYNGGATDLGGAIEHAHQLIVDAPFRTLRSVIDMAGDGPNNVNLLPTAERDAAVAAGITINALVVVGESAGLLDYFINIIIGGDGAFAEKAIVYADFEKPMLRKLVREIGAALLF